MAEAGVQLHVADSQPDDLHDAPDARRHGASYRYNARNAVHRCSAACDVAKCSFTIQFETNDAHHDMREFLSKLAVITIFAYPAD